MVERRLRAGIVGPHGIGRVHVDALRRIGVDVAGVAGATPASGRRQAEELAIGRSYPTAQALVESPAIDVVHICTPNDAHAQIARWAFDAGKHVVCEKPLATSLDDAMDLLSRAEAAGVVHAVCYVYRYYPMAKHLRDLVAGGTFGDVHLVHGTYLAEELLTSPSPWQLDAARTGPWLSAIDVGIHWFDLVEWVTGQRIISMVATRRAVRPNSEALQIGDVEDRTDDSDAVLLKLDGGASALAAISQTAPGYGNGIRIELNGTKASARWEQEDPNRLWLAPLGKPASIVSRTVDDRSTGAPTLQLPAGHPQGYSEAFRDLLASVYAHIRTPGSIALHPTFADGARSLRLLQAFNDSTRSATWSTVDSGRGPAGAIGAVSASSAAVRP
jgi:predicted dehydrogenase